MREIISIHIGQGGVQLGNSCWELFCLEHGIQPDGKMPMELNELKYQNKSDDAFLSFYSETGAASFFPRAVFIDLEPTILDDIRTGTYRQLFHPENLINGKEDTASNYARGHNTIGKEIIDICLDKIRKQSDNCTSLQGFLIYSSIGGGTGSGLGSLLLERLSVDYSKKTKVLFTIFPSNQTSTSPLEPYNSLLNNSQELDNQDVVNVVFDNQSLQDICKNKLYIESPNFTNLNRVIAQVISSITCSSRFEGCLYQEISEIQSHQVPYQRIHFLTSGYSPLIPKEYAGPENLEKLTTYDVGIQSYDQSNLMVNCNVNCGKFMSNALMFRGDVVPKDVGQKLIMKIKSTIKFVDWCPTGFKCGINYQPPTCVPWGEIGKAERGCMMLANQTGIQQILKRRNDQFDKMYKNRAFLHWYQQEGMNEDEFQLARENLSQLEQDYSEVEFEEAEENNEEV